MPNPITFYINFLRNPKTRWWTIGFTALYIISPIDLIPDFIPFAGLFDDGGLLATLLWSMYRIRKTFRK